MEIIARAVMRQIEPLIFNYYSSSSNIIFVFKLAVCVSSHLTREYVLCVCLCVCVCDMVIECTLKLLLYDKFHGKKEDTEG